MKKKNSLQHIFRKTKNYAMNLMKSKIEKLFKTSKKLTCNFNIKIPCVTMMKLVLLNLLFFIVDIHTIEKKHIE